MCIPLSDIKIDTLQYFLSADAQSMAAFFAVGGIFAIYRLQYIDGQINSTSRAYREFYKRQVEKRHIKNDKNQYVDDYDAREANEWLDKDIIYIMLKHYVSNEDNPGVMDYCFYIKKLFDAKIELVKGLRWPTASIILCFAVSLFCLYFVDTIHTLSELKLIFAFLILILNSTAIITMVYYIWRCFNLPETVAFNNNFVDSNFKDLRVNAIKIIKDEIMQYSKIQRKYVKEELDKFIN